MLYTGWAAVVSLQLPKWRPLSYFDWANLQENVSQWCVCHGLPACLQNLWLQINSQEFNAAIWTRWNLTVPNHFTLVCWIYKLLTLGVYLGSFWSHVSMAFDHITWFLSADHPVVVMKLQFLNQSIFMKFANVRQYYFHKKEIEITHWSISFFFFSCWQTFMIFFLQCRWKLRTSNVWASVMYVIKQQIKTFF